MNALFSFSSVLKFNDASTHKDRNKKRDKRKKRAQLWAELSVVWREKELELDVQASAGEYECVSREKRQSQDFPFR
jgi:hypothetical protein